MSSDSERQQHAAGAVELENQAVHGEWVSPLVARLGSVKDEADVRGLGEVEAPKRRRAVFRKAVGVRLMAASIGRVRARAWTDRHLRPVPGIAPGFGTAVSGYLYRQDTRQVAEAGSANDIRPGKDDGGLGDVHRRTDDQDSRAGSAGDL